MSKNTIYWNTRWGGETDPFDASWPDKYARWIELQFIAAHLRSLPDSTAAVYEIGCGPFTLRESPDVLEGIDAYYGVDASSAAIEAARAACGASTFECREIRSYLDLPPIHLSLTKNLILSRRTLQNMEPEVRRGILQRLHLWPHGIVIERTEQGTANLNDMRHEHGLPPLPSPPFNTDLTDEEVSYLEIVTKPRFLMGGYYAATRGRANLRDWDSRENWRAYAENTEDPPVGPVAFAW